MLSLMNCCLWHYSDVTWVSWRLQSSPSGRFVQYLVQANTKHQISVSLVLCEWCPRRRTTAAAATTTATTTTLMRTKIGSLQQAFRPGDWQHPILHKITDTNARGSHDPVIDSNTQLRFTGLVRTLFNENRNLFLKCSQMSWKTTILWWIQEPYRHEMLCCGVQTLLSLHVQHPFWVKISHSIDMITFTCFHHHFRISCF